MKASKIKIFISYKKQHKLLKNEVIQPIQTGRALTDKTFEGMLGDDTGDNISAQNHRYSELSAQYWVWKQYQEIGNPEYVGFMHYRRHFLFNKDFSLKNRIAWLPGMPIYRVAVTDKQFQNNLEPKHILDTLQTRADCYIIKPYDVRNFIAGDSYMKYHYINYVPGAKREAWDQFVRVITDLYPAYVPYLNQFMYGHIIYACNMFIMKKELFFEYSQFCFDVLKEVNKRVDKKIFTGSEQRFLGFLGEYLLTIFVMKLQKENKSIEYLDALFYENIDSKLAKHKASFYFSITNTPTHKVLVLFGKEFKLIRHSKVKILQQQLEQQNRQIQALESKITDLEELVLPTAGK